MNKKLATCQNASAAIVAKRGRADQVLVERGLFDSRARAQAAIAAGLVTADGRTVRKASDPVAADADLAAAEAYSYVSRGGVKLAAALDAFAIDPAGRICLDVGASTGGFTDVLLGRGATRIYAVDVGRGQLHPRIAAEPRAVSLEATDIRRLDPTMIETGIGLAVIDVSFISLTLVLGSVVRLLAPGADLVALVKPQFEAGRALVRKGIVRDAAVHEAVCATIRDHAISLGFAVTGLIPSPLAGGNGNREFLLGARLG